MRRREFLGVLSGAAVGWPLAARAQKSAKVPRIGYLGYSAPALEQHLLAAFQQGLRDIGYVENKIRRASMSSPQQRRPAQYNRWRRCFRYRPSKSPAMMLQQKLRQNSIPEKYGPKRVGA
jgi:hypothetical protein